MTQMKKGKNLLLLLTMLMGFLTLMSSCVDESARAGRPIIQRFGATEEGPLFCQATYHISERTCINSCPTGTRVANDQEIEEAKTELEGLNLDPVDLEDILSNIDAALEVCVQGSGVLRPNNEVFIDKGFCACQAGKPASINDCQATCQSKTQNNIVLFGRVTVGPNIQFNDVLKNLDGWCNADIEGSDFKGPACQLEVFDGDSTQFLELQTSGNTFNTAVDTLRKDVTYLARIRETQSGSNVQSSAFQFRLKDFEDQTTTPEGPLKIMPVSQYTCILLARQTEPVVSFTEFARKHFYFAASNNPPSLPPNNFTTKCHDKQTFGENDSPLFPRLELITQHFAVWDQTDIRFNDGDVDGVIDINEEITQEFRLKTGNTTAQLNLFTVFEWPNLPSIPNFKEGTSANLGFIMIPFVDQNNRGECPTQEDYLSNNPLYEVIGDKVGVDTEGLFMAESEPFLDSGGNSILDILMIRENELKKVWFYFENGQHFVPDQVTAGSKTIHFYWPLDPNAPYIRKSNQIIYTVRFPTDIGKNGVQTGIVEGVRPPDKRFACIPAVD